MNEQPELHSWEPSQGIEKLSEEINQRGLVLIKNISKSEQFLVLFSSLGKIYHHADSFSNGLTHIKYDGESVSRSNAAEVNKLGLTQGALVPHTDRSGIELPPRLLALWIERQSRIGGASIFADGQQIFEEISAHFPEAIEILSRPKSVVFKSESGLIEGSIFQICGDEFFMRFRFDRMVYLSPDVAEVMPIFLETLRKCLVKIRLNSNEGYLIDNHKWLHGRTHYSGFRSAYRLLIN